jgi:hypothetical protein
MHRAIHQATQRRPNRARPPIAATFRIRQTITSLHLRMESDQSEDELVCSSLRRKEDGGFRLPGMAVRAAS